MPASWCNNWFGTKAGAVVSVNSVAGFFFGNGKFASADSEVVTNAGALMHLSNFCVAFQRYQLTPLAFCAQCSRKETARKCA